MSEDRLFFYFFFLLKGSEFSVLGHGAVQVTAGEDIVLPCFLDPPFQASDLTVEWMCDGVIVHFYRNMNDDYNDQDERFRGRTSMFHEEMSRGNISLKLSNVQKEDSGLYFCYVPELQRQVKRGNILLRVHVQQEPGDRRRNDQTEDDSERIRDVQKGVIVSSVFNPLLLVTVSGVIFCCRCGFIRKRNRLRRPEKKKLEDYELAQGPKPEEQVLLSPLDPDAE
ncbi:uncharacterized protein V6R79_000018 [Siganus canaliculatus]